MKKAILIIILILISENCFAGFNKLKTLLLLIDSNIYPIMSTQDINNEISSILKNTLPEVKISDNEDSEWRVRLNFQSEEIPGGKLILFSADVGIEHRVYDPETEVKGIVTYFQHKAYSKRAGCTKEACKETITKIITDCLKDLAEQWHRDSYTIARDTHTSTIKLKRMKN